MRKWLNKQISFKKAFFYIVLSPLLFVVPPTSYVLFKYYQDKLLKADSKFNIIAISQTTPDHEKLKNLFFAEILNLSIDQPTNLFKFDLLNAHKKLLSTGVFQKVFLKKIPPSTLYVDYSLRKPIAYLKDLQNTMIDKEGFLFPFKPFFTPKNIPELYLGLENQNYKWGMKINESFAINQFSLYFLNFIQDFAKTLQVIVKKVDLSDLLSDSHGQRQIVIHLKIKSSTGNAYDHFLRLTVDDFRQELANYKSLFKKLLSENMEYSMLIDLRMKDLSLMKKL